MGPSARLLVLWLLLLGVVSVHVLTMAAVSWLVGAKPVRVRVGYAFAVLSATWAGVRFELGLLPLGGWVSFRTSDDEPDRLEGLASARRIMAEVSGCVVLIALGLALGAPVGALLQAPLQYVMGPLSPTEEGARLARSAWELLARPFPFALGVVALKTAAFNLLPVPGLNGFSALRALVSGILRRRVWYGTETLLWGLGFLVFLSLGWALTFGLSIWHALR